MKKGFQCADGDNEVWVGSMNGVARRMKRLYKRLRLVVFFMLLWAGKCPIAYPVDFS